MWYSWHNLSDKYNTNKLKYFEGKEWKIIIFPEGNYDFDDIQDFINDHFQTDDPPISIHANTVTLRTIVWYQDTCSSPFIRQTLVRQTFVRLRHLFVRHLFVRHLFV
jgi:hypothetical protein